jgi:hypothetical protein
MHRAGEFLVPACQVIGVGHVHVRDAFRFSAVSLFGDEER